MKQRSKGWVLSVTVCLLVVAVSVGWLGYEPYSGDGSIQVTDANNQPQEGMGKITRIMEFRQGLLVRDAVLETGSKNVDPRTHSAYIWRWSVWNQKRALNNAVVLVRDGLRALKLESAEKVWQEWINKSVLSSSDRGQVPDSAGIWEAKLRPGDQIVFWKH
jgi:hypothetical protein